MKGNNKVLLGSFVYFWESLLSPEKGDLFRSTKILWVGLMFLKLKRKENVKIFKKVSCLLLKIQDWYK